MLVVLGIILSEKSATFRDDALCLAHHLVRKSLQLFGMMLYVLRIILSEKVCNFSG